jgi:gamma-glutamyl-gamma-aminobutyrate hydrolase PuuD
MLKQQRIQEADLIGPKCMVIRSYGVLQHADQHRQGLRAAVTGLAHNAKAPILGQCAGSPTILNVIFKPLRSANMVYVIAIVQRN